MGGYDVIGKAGRATALLIVLVAAQLPRTPAQAFSYAWTQYGLSGLEARAATDAKACPSLDIDGSRVPMRPRALPDEAFPLLACALPIAASVKTVTMEGTPLPLAPPAPRRIAVLGDSGCRLKEIYLQACNDPQQWPFATIAAAIAAKAPDLIIHVGDYHYRETPCPKGDAGCEGSPFGDNWDVWREDFFKPVSPLLQTAPWVFVRGNHEDCKRGGRGWSRLLEPAEFDASKSCNKTSAPYVVRLPKMTLAVVDTATAPEPNLDAEEAKFYREQYAGLPRDNTPVWLLQHRPIWSTGGTVAGLPFGDNKTLAAAARDTLAPNVQLMLSGHHHIFQVLSYVDDLPVQLVVGHGGDYLNLGRSADPAGWVINGVRVRSGLHLTGQFGFVLMESRGDDWVVTNHDREGTPRQHCTVTARQAKCSK